MYPSENVESEQIPIERLPAQLLIQGQLVAKNPDEASYGSQNLGVFLEGDKWARYVNGNRTEQGCLIQGAIQDTFLDSYKITIALPLPQYEPEAVQEFIEIIVNRTSRCVWQEETCNVAMIYTKNQDYGPTLDPACFISYFSVYPFLLNTFFIFSNGLLPGQDFFLEYYNNSNDPTGPWSFGLPGGSISTAIVVSAP